MASIVKKKKNEVKVVPGDGYCRRCQKVMSLNNFYEATNPRLDSNGYLSICKKCCAELYNHYFSIYGNIADAIKEVCMDLDILYSNEILKQVQSHIEKLTSRGQKADAVFGYYKSKLGSTGKNNERLEYFRFRDSIILNEQNMEEKINININLDTDFELTPDILRFWGNMDRFDKWHYEYLTNKYNEYISTYECETPVMEELLKQAAFESLEILIKRKNNQDASKHLKNLQDILGTANIKPNQETGANATDQMTYGLLIKKWENEDPIPEPDEEWKDVDGIGKYIRIWFLGHLCKILGIVNEYSQEYEEEMSKLRVEMPSSEEVLLDEGEEGEFDGVLGSVKE